MSTLYEHLKDNYKEGEPIFSSDICIQNLSPENIRQQFKKLSDSHKLIRYEKGIYYLPKQSRLKGEYRLSADLVARYKYIARQGKVMGYYAGYTLANQIGLSTQVPVKTEIVSNNMSAIVRDVLVGDQIFTIKKAKIKVTKENYQTLQFLEILKDLDKYSDMSSPTTRIQLTKYIEKNNIKKEIVDLYIVYFPIKIYKSIYEMELERVFA